MGWQLRKKFFLFKNFGIRVTRHFQIQIKVILISYLIIAMITKLPLIEATLKEESQTPTEASSEFNPHSIHIEEDKREDICNEDEYKKDQNRLKYRKLKQKLNSMGFNHQDKCLINKDFSSPKKQRILKLALDYEKLIKVQNRDYLALQITCREIFKIMESKQEQDLQLIRQSRFIPAFFQFIQKVPSLYKNQFSQVLKSLETGLRVMLIFSTLQMNREYLIMTNRLNSLVSLISWILGREEKKGSGNSCLYSIESVCFKLINCLLLHKSKDDSILCICNTTIQLIVCSQMFKKIKVVLLEQLYAEDMVIQSDLIMEILKFMLFIIRKSQRRLTPIFSLTSNSVISSSEEEHFKESQFTQTHQLDDTTYPKIVNSSVSKLIELLIPFLFSYFNLLQQSQSLEENQKCAIYYPVMVENAMRLIIKNLNACFQLSFVVFKKVVGELDKENQSLLNSFFEKVQLMIKYCKDKFEESNENANLKAFLNEMIILVGYMAVDDSPMQKKISQAVIEQISDLPIQFLMDSHLKQILIPTLCCLLNANKANLNYFLKDNSPIQIIKFLKKEIQSKPSLLVRKNSTTSLMSVAVISNQYNAISYDAQRLTLEMRFPQEYWEPFCQELLEKQKQP